MHRVHIGRDEIAPAAYRWYATEHGLDLDVPCGSGATPLAAIADLLMALDIEDVEPASLSIEWECGPWTKNCVRRVRRSPSFMNSRKP